VLPIRKRIEYRWDDGGKTYVVSKESFSKHNPKTHERLTFFISPQLRGIGASEYRGITGSPQK
jgi:hypothetical protein